MTCRTRSSRRCGISRLAERDRGTVVAVVAGLLLALGVRVAYVFASRDYQPIYDAADYLRLGVSIAQGHGFGVTRYAAGGGPTALRPPLYPMFLAAVIKLTAGSQPAIRLAQAALGTVTVAATALAAHLVWGRRVALVTLFAGALYAPLVLLGGAELSEWLSVMLQMCAVAAGLLSRRVPSRWAAAAAGALAGLSILARPNSAAFLPALMVLATPPGAPARPPRGRLVPAALVLALCVLTLVPWTVRNVLVMGRLVPVTTQAGYVMAGVYNSAARDDTQYPASWRSPLTLPATSAIYRDRALREVQVDERQRAVALDFIRANPVYPLHVAAWNIAYMSGLRADYLAASVRGEMALGDRSAVLAVVGFLPFAVVALAGAFTRRAREAPWSLWAVGILPVTATMFLQGTARFRSPADPFIVVLAALALAAAGDWLRERGAGR